MPTISPPSRDRHRRPAAAVVARPGKRCVETSVQKAFRLLEFLAESERPVTLAEAAAVCRLPKTSAFRLLKVLHALGYADQPAGARGHVLGARVAQLAGSDPNTTLKRMVRPLLEGLHGELDETVNLGVLSNHRIVYADYIETTRALRMIVSPGAWEPWYLTAVGLAIASALPEDEQEQLLVSTDYTQAAANGRRLSPAILRPRLRVFRRQGWAEEEEAAVSGVACLAVPLATLGFVRAAISVAVPVARLSRSRRARIGELLRSSLVTAARHHVSR
ncbi:MAG: IclR family transcriptional regulator [Chthoniobacterales bacterium]|nr:IclR family transcriptional regulator [Chthoniobacterales bacterium]